MDRPLNQLITLTARNFLSTNPKVETFVPQSHQSTLYALQLLSSLEKLTQASLKTELAPQETQTVTQNGQAGKTPTPQTKEQSLVQALMELRKSKRFMKRLPGVYNSIIRSHPV